MRSKACNQHARSYTVNAKKVGLAGALVAFLASPAGAQTLTVEKARAIVTPFYEALNRPPEKDVAKLLEQATSSDWMSCGGNDACFPREKVIGGFKSRGAILPDLSRQNRNQRGDSIVRRCQSCREPDDGVAHRAL